MNVTRLNPALWGISSFEYIGYDKEAEILAIFFTAGHCLSFRSIKEQLVFQFLINTNKEAFIEEHLIPHFPSSLTEEILTDQVQ